MAENETITLTIDGVEVTAPKGSTILEAAKLAGITIPTLCYLKDVDNAIGACRMCLVQVNNSPKLAAACVFPAADGMDVVTNSPLIAHNRKMNLQLLLSNITATASPASALANASWRPFAGSTASTTPTSTTATATGAIMMIPQLI